MTLKVFPNLVDFVVHGGKITLYTRTKWLESRSAAEDMEILVDTLATSQPSRPPGYTANCCIM